MLRQIAGRIPGARRAWRALNRSTSPTAVGPNLALRHARELEKRFPDLLRFGLPLNDATAVPILEFYNAYLPLIYPPAHDAHVRTLLYRLRSACPPAGLAATKEIAKRDLKDGLPDRAGVLRECRDAGPELARQIIDFDASYGAALLSKSWPGASRDAALLHYFTAHPDLVRAKDVLHIAPEPDVGNWLSLNSRSYRTMDGTPGEVDFVSDITDINSPDRTFDVAICHRVLEHVLDDVGALREIYRILRPGGLLNLSVPQAAHRPKTVDWTVPDESHHQHVRQYGQDLIERISSVGFSVQIETWLLERPREELLSKSAFPMRMFNARKV